MRNSELARRPSRDGRRIYFVEDVADSKTAFKSVRLDGGDERTIFTSKYATQFEQGFKSGERVLVRYTPQ